MAAIDKTGGRGGVSGSASNAFAIAPSNDNQLDIVTRGIYVGVSGDLKVDMDDSGTAIAFVGLASGIIHPIRARKVYATGTTATNIVGVY